MKKLLVALILGGCLLTTPTEGAEALIQVGKTPSINVRTERIELTIAEKVSLGILHKLDINGMNFIIVVGTDRTSLRMYTSSNEIAPAEHYWIMILESDNSLTYAGGQKVIVRVTMLGNKKLVDLVSWEYSLEQRVVWAVHDKNGHVPVMNVAGEKMIVIGKMIGPAMLRLGVNETLQKTSLGIAFKF